VTIYLDTSVLLTFVLEESGSEEVRNWLRRARGPFIVSDLARLEFSAVATRETRTGRYTTGDATRALAIFDRLRGHSLPLRHSRADFDLAEAFLRDFETKLRAPDALHLASARNAHAAFATLDLRLAEAGRAQGAEVVDFG